MSLHLTLEYRVDAAIAPSELAELYRRSGIRRPADDLPRVARMLAGANLTVSAWREGRLLGIARALTDFSFCCYLADLAVDADVQRRGIGRELVRRLRDHLGEEVMIVLLAAPTAEHYYAGLGFEKVENGWRLPRTR